MKKVEAFELKALPTTNLTGRACFDQYRGTRCGSCPQWTRNSRVANVEYIGRHDLAKMGVSTDYIHHFVEAKKLVFENRSNTMPTWTLPVPVKC
ncbi:MAG: hypothetical protein R2822_23840 [Spirosomataceae bacterium]